jgi:type II secretory pathway pseudopilin PulG
VTPHRSPKTARSRGFTLLEAALVVSIAGMVLAVAIPTFFQKLETSKAAEATKQLETLYRSAASYYAVARPTTGPKLAYCVPSAAGPTPLVASANPVKVDFSAPDTPGSETWRALEFAPKEKLRYRYSLIPRGATCLVEEPEQPSTLTLRAEGDLDGDGTMSRFERRAELRAYGVLEPDPMLHITDRIE